MNKYKKWYSILTENAKNRLLSEYSENHHIIPKSLGGLDTDDNIVKLTAREHFICHWLLVKIYSTGEEHWKMLNALRIMRAENTKQYRYTTAITSRVYAKLKEEYAILQSNKVSGKNNPMYGAKFTRSEDGKRKQREAILGDKNGSKNLEARQKISQSKLGRKREPFSEEWKEKLSIAKQGSNNNMFGKTHSEETKKKMRDKATGRKFSAEVIEKRASAQRGLVRPKKLCPHCQQQIPVNTYPRWHGDNCKSK